MIGLAVALWYLATVIIFTYAISESRDYLEGLWLSSGQKARYGLAVMGSLLFVAWLAYLTALLYLWATFFA